MIMEDTLLRLAVAVLLGGLVGLERTVAGKHAGMRTYALVSLGSCLFIVVGTLASFELSVFNGLNPLVVASNIILGVGFIGAGLAVFRNNGAAHVELTTAAGIWVVAAVGMAAGFGFFSIAAVSAVLAVLVFSVLLRLENMIRRRFGTELEQ